MFPNDEMAVRAKERLFLSGGDIISDLRRYGNRLASQSSYVSRGHVAFNGLGFRAACSFREAIRTISDVPPGNTDSPTLRVVGNS